MINIASHQLNLTLHRWHMLSEQRAVLDDLAKKLNIKDKSEWYGVHPSRFQRHGAITLLRRYNGSLFQLLSTVYPEYLFEMDVFF